MGIVYLCEPCDQCVYQPQRRLRFHTGVMGIFIGLATCQQCHELVSVFPSRANIAPKAAETAGIEGAVRYPQHVARVVAARADLYPNGIPLDTCLHCGSTHIDYWHIWEDDYPLRLEHGIYIPCPQCAPGRLKLITEGMWD
jgi:hypothetical protein